MERRKHQWPFSLTRFFPSSPHLSVLAGLGLQTKDFSQACAQWKVNLFVQTFSFCACSSIIFGVTRILLSLNILEKGLADGMVVCSCLPMTISSNTVFTKMCGGDEAAAIFNAALGNALAVILSPLLIVAYIGPPKNGSEVSTNSDKTMAQIFAELALRIVVPVIVGQVLQKTSPWVVRFHTSYKLAFQKGQMYAIIWIVYNVFCKNFYNSEGLGLSVVFTMVFMQLLFFCGLASLAWMFMTIIFNEEPRLVIMGFFGCTHKTVAIGVPMIGAIYANDKNVALYTLPLLVWYPLQLFVGSLLVPRLSRYVTRETRRLRIKKRVAEHPEILDNTKHGSWELDPQRQSPPPPLTPPHGSYNHNDQMVWDPDQVEDIEVQHQERGPARVLDSESDDHSVYSDDDNNDSDDEEDEQEQDLNHDDEDEAIQYYMPAAVPWNNLGPHGLHSAESATPTILVHGPDTDDAAPPRPKRQTGHKDSSGGSVGSSSTSQQSSRSSSTRNHHPQGHPRTCTSDHTFYYESLVYERETRAGKVYLDGAVCQGGCRRPIVSNSRETGIVPSDTRPIFVCKRCMQHVICYDCWTQARTPGLGESMWNLYG
jgi:solute carrier family 10 (sodium/bile acid cotransporter), member 7